MFPQIFGKYVLEQEVAAGGMARVFLATLRGAGGFEKRLVVKQIRPELACDEAFVRRFVAEAKTTVHLGHPNIVPVYELGVEQGIYYIAMERCEGVTLADVLADGPLEPELGAHLGVELCRALDYAHRRANIVHRDVTPRNVMIDEEGAVRVIDFGIAAPAGAELGGVCEVFGSPGHMPPEQLAGRVLSPASDVFAVAVLLREAWTGIPPFRRESARESARALEEPLPPLRELEPRLAALDAVMGACLERDPEKRPQEAEQLGRALRDFVRAHDSGDLARRLGARVRSRAARRQSTPPSTSGTAPLGATPVLRVVTPPAASAPMTRSFAMRDDLVEWTRKLDPSADSDSLQPISSRPAEARPRRPAWGWAAVAAAALIAVAAWPGSRPAVALTPVLSRLPRANLEFAAQPGSLPEAAALPPPSAIAAQATSRSPEPAAPPSMPPGSESGARTPRDHGSAAARPRASTARAVLRLTADLPAMAIVSGQSYSALPHVVEIAPGEHVVTFRTRDIEEQLRTTIRVGAGEQLGVHADFTSASPRVVLR